MSISKEIRQRRIVEITNDITAILNMVTVLEAEGLPVPARAIAAVQVLQRERYRYFTLRQRLTQKWLEFKHRKLRP